MGTQAQISHRRWVHLSFFLAAIIWLSGCESEPPATTAADSDVVATTAVEPITDSAQPKQDTVPSAPIRENISTFVQDPQKVADYRKAVETMRANGAKDPSSAEFRSSLQFWANTHGYFGTGGNATSFQDTVDYRKPQCLGFFMSRPYRFNKSDSQALCESYYTAASQSFTPDTFAENIWGTCQHTPHSCQHGDTQCEYIRSTPRFLPWHRLYLYYYERALRKYSGSDEFALPYWNYFDYPANDSSDGKHPNLWLPPLVSEGGSIQDNTFYDELRTYWLNEEKTSMTPDNASARDAFAEPTFVDFSNTLEGVPHGAMHCAVGNGCTAPHIGWVPVAGNDPVFYMHHANIDRLWQCWMVREAAGAKIDLAWAKANLGMPEAWYEIQYEFADENGNKVYKTIADAFSPEVLAVHYDEEVDCQIESTSSSKLMTLAAFEAVDDQLQNAEMVLMAGKIDLATKAQTIQLSPEVELLKQEHSKANTLLESIGEVTPGVWLILENILVKEACLLYTSDAADD